MTDRREEEAERLRLAAKATGLPFAFVTDEALTRIEKSPTTHAAWLLRNVARELMARRLESEAR